MIEGDLVWIQIGGGSGVAACALLGERREDGVFAESSSCCVAWW